MTRPTLLKMCVNCFFDTLTYTILTVPWYSTCTNTTVRGTGPVLILYPASMSWTPVLYS